MRICIKETPFICTSVQTPKQMDVVRVNPLLLRSWWQIFTGELYYNTSWQQLAPLSNA